MKRDQATRAPDFYRYARDYLHSYLPTAARRSPNTIEAYRISLECFLTYLDQQHHVGRAHVSFDHFDRPHLKGWLSWMSDQQHYAPRTIGLRLSAVKAFLTYSSAEDVTLVALNQAAKTLRARSPLANRSSTSPSPRHGPCWPPSPGAPRSHAGIGCCSSCSTTAPPGSVRSPA
jgi:hypothetical protein